MGLFGDSFISDRLNNKERTNNSHQCQWIAPGQAVTIRGFKITRGNFYTGEKFLVAKRYKNHRGDGVFLYASVVNESLTISEQHTIARPFHSYTDMDSYYRYQYLKWLSGQRKRLPLSHEILSLHLTGLSLRMFCDERTTDDERKKIIIEVRDIKRLLESKDKPTDYKFFYEFIDSAMTRFFSKADPLLFVNSQELKCLNLYKVKILSDLLKENNVISCKSLYEYAKKMIIPCDQLAPEEYDAFAYNLFSTRFYKHYPDGIKAVRSYTNSLMYELKHLQLRNSKFIPESLDMRYHVTDIEFYLLNINTTIKECYQRVYDSFNAYNKAVQANNGKKCLNTISLLPKQLDISKTQKVKELTIFFDKKLSDCEHPIVAVNDVLKQWDYTSASKALPKTIIDSILTTFDKLGYGIEPDYRIHGKHFKQGTECVLFTKSLKTPIKVDQPYSQMQAMIKMAVVLIQTDDEINPTKKEYVVNYIATNTKDDAKTKQLTAYFEFLAYSKQKYAGFNKFPDLFDKEGVKEIDDFLLKLAFVDTDINSKEIKVVNKIMDYFKIDSADIHSKIHRMYTGEDAPIRQSKENKQFIDTNKLLRIEQDTVKSKLLLSEIFTSEEEEEDEKMPSNDKQQDKTMIILETLLSKESWSRKEVESLCAEHNMMLGSALEAINDYAYSKIDDAVVEDEGERIYITTEYKDQLI